MLLRPLLLFAFLAAAAHPAAAYTFTGSHWYSASVSLQLQLGPSAGTLSDGSTSWGASAEDALATWNSYIGATRFTVVRDSTAAKAGGNRLNNVFFDSSVYGEAWGSGVLAITLTYTSGGTQTTETDVIFNRGLTWDSYRGAQRYSGSTGVYDFHRVALHEFGHVLGLDHPDEGGQSVVAIMNSHVTNLDALAADDITGAQSIYGANAAIVASAPVITSQPASQTVYAGASASFSVGVSSSGAVACQWTKNGAAIPGATTSLLALANVTSAAAGDYAVTVSNSAGSTTSNAAHLTVNTPTPAPAPAPAPVYPPAIVTPPASRTVNQGDRVSFSVSAAGTAPFAYAWRKNGTVLPGATLSSYTVESAQGGDAGNYTVVVSNTAGSVTSGVATLTVTAAPALTLQPSGQTVNLGGSLTLTAAASGLPAPAYQWYQDGTPLAGATAATLALVGVRAADAGTYTVRATNSSGSATSAPAVVIVNTPPVITLPPASQTVWAGERVVLGVTATGTPAPGYQWQKNGMNIAGATGPTFSIGAASASDAGTYAVVITNVAGSTTTVPVLLTVNFSQLVNLSTRGFVPVGGALTAGFVLRGSSDKPVLVRGIGPALNGFGVRGTLSDPQLTVMAQESAQTLAVNDSWSLAPQLATAFQSVGAFALPAGSADSASEIRLQPGAYTTRVTSEGSANGGVAMAEVYDAETGSARSRLVNLSTLGFTGSGEMTLVGGFSIQGTAPKRVLIRAVGPGLAPYGVAGALADPRFEVFPLGETTAIAANDDWGGTADLQASFASAGAFPLPTTSRDAAIVLSLPAGGYTLTVSGSDGAPGYVLLEIYDLDP